MIVVFIGEKKKVAEIVDLVYSFYPERFIRFNFRDAKDAIKGIMGGLRVSSDKKYLPFFKIIKKLSRDGKNVLVDDCNNEERLVCIRALDCRFIHVGNMDYYIDGDLYIEKRPDTLKEMKALIETIDAFAKKKETIYRGDGWVLTED